LNKSLELVICSVAPESNIQTFEEFSAKADEVKSAVDVLERAELVEEFDFSGLSGQNLDL
jgi:hypothetical protein